MADNSLYAAIRVACLVQKAKDCLIFRINKNILLTRPPGRCPTANLDTCTCEKVASTVKPQPTSSHSSCQLRVVRPIQRRNVDLSSLCDDIDNHISYRDLPLRAVASQDSLFIKHDVSITETVKSLEKKYDILDLTTRLLKILQSPSGSKDTRVDIECGKFLANLEHLLRCLQQIALDAIFRHSETFVEALRWLSYWQNRKRIGEGWFTEWPNGHRPLSTTWPWNVKTSLLVLWGVCWMFYGASTPYANTQDQQRTARNPAQGEADFSGDFGPRLLGSPPRPSPQAPSIPDDSSDAWANPAANIHPNYSWLHPQQAGFQSRRANDVRGVLGTTVPSYQTSESVTPYITSTSPGASNLFATSSAQWPYSQGINQDSSPAYYTPWQQSYSQVENIAASLTTAPLSIGSQTPGYTYAPQRQAIPKSQAAVGRSLGFAPGLHLQDMQDYPSPRSNVSEQTTASCMSVLPGAMVSPRIPTVTSPTMSVVPSAGGSTHSRESSRRSTEPPRNAQGNLYCADPECARLPPVFSRKCEWTKHMDKHNRPYVCEEPECDNIRGFTYSGGLLRHQREVHRQHGGPKATCMCPHKDCKRSTGVGFSRKENLNEHLRRCHQPRDRDTDNPKDGTEEGSSKPRKRRRVADDDDDGGGGGGGEKEDHEEMQREVKRLRKELAEKEDRIRNLEKWMENLTRAHGELK